MLSFTSEHGRFEEKHLRMPWLDLLPIVRIVRTNLLQWIKLMLKCEETSRDHLDGLQYNVEEIAERQKVRTPNCMRMPRIGLQRRCFLFPKNTCNLFGRAHTRA